MLIAAAPKIAHKGLILVKAVNANPATPRMTRIGSRLSLGSRNHKVIIIIARVPDLGLSLSESACNLIRFPTTPARAIASAGKSTTAVVEAMAPSQPKVRHPTSVVALSATGPGVACAMAISEEKAPASIHRGTVSDLITPTTVQPPPKEMTLILKNDHRSAGNSIVVLRNIKAQHQQKIREGLRSAEE